MTVDCLSSINIDELKKYFKLTTNCPLCMGKENGQLFVVNQLCIIECMICHFRYMNPSLSEKGMSILYENSKILSKVNPALERYYEYADIRNSRTLKDYQMVLNFAQKHLKSNRKPKLFEVGYGTGGFLLEAIRSGWSIDGIETSKQNSDYLRKQYGLEVQCGTFDDFEPVVSDYQMVALWDVVEHTIDPHSFVRKAYRMLAPGGLLVLATPNISGLLNTVSESVYRSSGGVIKWLIKQLYVIEHVGYYTPNTLNRLILNEGFERKKIFFTETDLKRYKFSLTLHACLVVFFLIAKCLNRQNRMIYVAQKKSL